MKARSSKRFVDLAHHGGCSQKFEPVRLRELLAPLASSDSPGWSDAGISVVGEQIFASSVDVVLPMIDDPELFGRIVAIHVLSDLYAVGARPVFALNVLGIPERYHHPSHSPPPEIDSGERGLIDAEVQLMLVAAMGEIEAAGAKVVGGHTLKFDVLVYGLAATGLVAGEREISVAGAEAGDLLVLTKPIGTSVATKSWKATECGTSEFSDVVAGMLRSNRNASEAMASLSRCACTDVTGFGFLGHLQNMLGASKVSAALEVADMPVYASSKEKVTEDLGTKIFEPNRDYVAPHVRNLELLDEREKLLWMDAQISGGLLISMPADEVDAYRRVLDEAGEECWVVGEVTGGEAGTVTLA